MRGTSQRIAVTALAIITVILIGISVFIAIRLQETPTDVSVSGCVLGSTQCQTNNAGNTGFLCTCVAVEAGNRLSCSEYNTSACPVSSGTTDSSNSCSEGAVQTGGCGTNGCASNQRPISVCVSGSYEARGCTRDNNCGGDTTTTTTTTTTDGDGTGAGGCVVDNPSVSSGSITLSAECGTYTGSRFERSVPAGTTSQECVGTSSNESSMTFSGGNSYSPGGSCGKCVQIDVVINGTPYGTARYTGDCSGTTTTTTTTTTYSCSNDFQCVAVSGSGGQYSTLSSCSTNCVDSPDPVCGDSCTTDSECPNNHFCSEAGTCTLNGCEDGNCLNGCSPICGGPCDPGDPNSCPDDHRCSATTNTCRLLACDEAGVECVNGCTVIPDTAIFDGENGNLLSGLFLIVVAIIIVRFNLIGRLNLLINSGSDLDKQITRIQKQRSKFEDKFNE